MKKIYVVLRCSMVDSLFGSWDFSDFPVLSPILISDHLNPLLLIILSKKGDDF